MAIARKTFMVLTLPVGPRGLKARLVGQFEPVLDIVSCRMELFEGLPSQESLKIGMLRGVAHYHTDGN